MHIDINQFFAAATVLLEPSLKNKPLIIAGSSRRGIVSTASYEARKYGIHSAMPTYMAKKLCPNVIIRPVNFEWYNQKSHEFFSFIEENYTKKIEKASIDECYVDMTDLMKDVTDPLKYLKELQDNLYKNTLLQVSIGIGPTKFLAKMGSDYKKPMGITIIRKKDIKRILYPLPIDDFFGIGKKTCPKLKEIGINTIGDFAVSDSYKVKEIMGKFYFTAKKWVNGEGDDVVENTPFDPKSISSTTTLLYDSSDYEEIKKIIEQKSHEIALTAKQDKKIGKTITLILKDASFKSITRSVTIEKPTNDFIDIYTSVMKLFDKFFTNQSIRLVGVGLSQLMNIDEFYVQISLFNQVQEQKECSTKLLINKLNRRANKKLFTIASDVKKDKDGI